MNPSAPAINLGDKRAERGLIVVSVAVDIVSVRPAACRPAMGNKWL